MKRLLRWSLTTIGVLLLLMVFGVLALGTGLYFVIEPEARIVRPPTIGTAQVERAVQLFLRHDPRRLQSGVPDSLSVQQEDLDLALNYFAGRFAHTSSELVIGDGTAWLRTSTRLPATRQGNTLNIEMQFRPGNGLPRVERLRVGPLTVPAVLANLLLDLGRTQLPDLSPGTARAIDSIDQIGLRPGMLDLRYTWRGKTPGQAGMRFWSAEEQARIDAYLAVLRDASTQWPPPFREPTKEQAKDGSMPLAALVRPLLQAAARRSANDAAAVMENRAALVALAQFVNAGELAAAFPEAAGLAAQVKPHPITLNGRTDTAQHFTVSAALSAMAGSPLSDAVGMYKELADAQGGSGFSFNDLAADRAGSRFGDMATASDSTARQLHRRFAATQAEAVLLPPVTELPEGMQLAEFNRRFGGVDGAGSRRLRADIERRLSTLPLYR